MHYTIRMGPGRIVAMILFMPLLILMAIVLPALIIAILSIAAAAMAASILVSKVKRIGKKERNKKPNGIIDVEYKVK